jgi:transcriptional regulator with XRE-family HTH domain
MGDLSRVPVVREQAVADEELGRKIRLLRQTHGKSLRQLSSQAGLSATHLSEIERGHSSPTASALARIAGALHRSPGELLQDDQDPWVVMTREREFRVLTQKDGLTVKLLNESPSGARIAVFLLEIEDGAAHRAVMLENSKLVCLYSLSGKTLVEMDGGQAVTLAGGSSLQTVVGSACFVRGEGGPGKLLAFVSRQAPMS